MKTIQFMNFGAAAAVSLAVFQGCAFGPRPRHFVKYDIPCADDGAAKAAIGAGAAGAARADAAFAVGKVRAAPDAAGRALRAVDAATGRSAAVSGWELAAPPEALVARCLRGRIAALNPDALVLDASMAPRGIALTMVECWIETFRVEKRGGGWFFVFRADIYETAPGGKTEGRRVASETKISDGGAEPPPEKIVRAIGEAMECLL